MIVGCDTGFFKHFLESAPKTLELWRAARAGESELVISCITLFELRRLGFRGAIPLAKATSLLTHLPVVCTVIWLDRGNAALLEAAARMAHGNGLSMADALILASFVHAGVDVVVTTDADMLRYTAGPEIVRL